LYEEARQLGPFNPENKSETLGGCGPRGLGLDLVVCGAMAGRIGGKDLSNGRVVRGLLDLSVGLSEHSLVLNFIPHSIPV
jgi:hypothetical protein